MADELLNDAVRRLWLRGKSAWPDLLLELMAFSHHVLGRLGTEATPEGLGRLNGEDLYLAVACLSRMPGAVDAFEACHGARIERRLRTMNVRNTSIAELRQALLVKLFVSDEAEELPAIAQYSGRGALAVWLRMTVARMALNLQRDEARITGLRDSLHGAEAWVARDVELAFIRGHYEEDFRAALREALAALSRAERLLLRMHYRQGLNMDQLAAVVHTSRATAHRRLVAARDSLWERVRASLKARLHLSAPEMESLLGVVRSQFALTLADELHKGLDTGAKP